MLEHDYNSYPELTTKQIETENFNSPHKQYTEDFDATVVKVHDGDTITLRTEERDFDFPLRFSDIDSPEMNNGGEIAREFVKGLILDEDVRIKINKKQRVGKYGRLLGKVISRGIDIGQAELRLGYAQPFGKKLEGEIPKKDKVFSLRQWF